MYSRVTHRRALAFPAAAATALVLLLTVAPSATASATPSSEVAFQANTGILWTYNPGDDSSQNSNLGMDPFSSPSIADGEVAFTSNQDLLWLYHPGDNSSENTQISVQAGTSPAIAAGPDGYGVAFQAGDGNLGMLYPLGGGAYSYAITGLGMKVGTSPSIVALSNGTFEVAFDSSSGQLFIYNSGTGGDFGTGQAMDGQTSPAITQLANGDFQIAYVRYVSYTQRLLSIYTTNVGNFDTGLGVATGTSPSFADGEVAFQASLSTFLWLYHPGNNTSSDTGLGMYAGTSPAIASVSGTYLVAFMANTGILWIYNTSGGVGGSNLGMRAFTSPAISS